ncbi:MAG: dihydrolipoamide acetyltransferase family protein [Candidatus Neomarinimicrobiota bacterium]
MIVDVIMPKMGESINEGTILEWRKKVGDVIQLDEILLEIGTDKVDSEIPSSAAGIVVEILAGPNDIKEVGEVIARIDTDSNGAKKIIASDNMDKDKIIESVERPVVRSTSIQKDINKQSDRNRRKVFYTPVVMKIATEQGLPLNELELIIGTGRGGRVTKKDILSYLKDRESVASTSKTESMTIGINKSGRSEEMHHMRKMISKHMMESLSTSAHVYVMTEVDMTSIVDFVNIKEKSFRNKEEYSLTYTPFIVDSVIRALKEYPEMNSSISGEVVNYHRDINIGLAVAIDNGLMVPSISNCEEKNFLGLCRSIYDVASRTRNGNIDSDELSGTTFTITNFGVFGVSIGTPIINQPNVGILGVGAVKKQPVVIEAPQGDSIAIRSMMMLTLGFDHRLIDGAGGSRFLKSICNNIENMDLGDIL